MQPLRLAARIFPQEDLALSPSLLNWPPGSMGLFVLLLGTAVASAERTLSFARRCSELEARNTQLESRLAELRLRSVKGELRPHFLLNTLHLISSLIEKDAGKADETLANLGDMLRISLANSERSEILLGDELAFVERYLAIARARYGSRVKVHMAVDTDCLNALVPELVLQPLVENSVRHAVAKESRAHHIVVAARRRGDKIRLKVSDDGPGAPALEIGRLEEGVGLAATRRQLQLLYRDDHVFEMRNESAGGVTVLIELPFRLAARDDPTGSHRRLEERDGDSNADRRRRAASA